MFSNYNSIRAKAFRATPILGDKPLGISVGSFSQQCYNSRRSIFWEKPLGISVGSFSQQCYNITKSIFGDRPLEISVGSFSQQCFNSIIVVTELEPSGV